MIRKVSDFQPGEKQVLERALGQPLRNEQQLRIEILPVSKSEKTATASEPSLPEWCDVYQGLTDEEISALEASILDRSHWSR